MNQITGVNARLKNILTKYRLFSLIWLVFLAFQPSLCSAQDARVGIKELKNGTLLVRFPSYKNKIDTLTAMISRVTDEASMKRFEGYCLDGSCSIWNTVIQNNGGAPIKIQMRQRDLKNYQPKYFQYFLLIISLLWSTESLCM